ncbi:DUF4337 domain-containing protein [Chitinimonas naiadis]
MADDKKEPWLNHLALMTVILAVCATLSTFKGGGYSTRSVITQSQASDQWAYYQAKSTKQNLYEVELSQLQLQSLSLPNDPEIKAAYAKKVADYQAKVARYESERKTIEAEARKLEEQRDDAQKHGKPFGMAVIFLQVAILLNSIAGLMKVQRIWHLSIPVGLAGVAFFANGFFLFF